MLQRHTTKPQTLRFSSHTSLFWTLPEQLSILHHACVPTHPEDTPQNLRPQDFHLTHPSFELCRSNSPYYTMHMCQPILNQRPKTHYKLQSENFHLTHPCFELCRNNSEQMTPRICANPEPMLQRHTTKPQTLRFSSNTSLFWTLPEQLSILHHACVTTLNQRPKDTPQNLRPQDFHLTHPSFELCRSNSPYYTMHMCQPILNQRPKTHYKLQSENFHLTHPCFELCRNNSEQMTPRICANPEPMLQRHTTKPQTLRFSSNTSLFWTLPEQLSILMLTYDL